MRREIRVPRIVRITLLAIGVLVFAIGSFVPNATGGILALLSGLLVVFLFLFTTSTTAGESGEGEKHKEEEDEADSYRLIWPAFTRG